MKRSIFVLAAALAVSTVASASTLTQAAASKITFPSVSQKGLKVTYSTKVSLTVNGMAIDFLSDAAQTVQDVAENGNATVEEVDSNISIMSGGQPIPAPSDQKSTYTIDKMGRLQAITASDAAPADTAAKMFNLSAFLLPDHAVAAGDSWTVELPADKKLGTVPIKAVYTFVKQDKWKAFDVYEIKYSIKETGDGNIEASEGVMMIDTKTGMIDHLTGSMTNVSLPGVPTPVNGTTTIERKS